MKSLTKQEMQGLQGGLDAITTIGGIACGVALMGPIGAAIGGPTCAGMLLAAWLS